MAAVTPDRLQRVRADLTAAVTAEGTLLPAPDQDRLLAQACEEACALLQDWLLSPEWASLRPRRNPETTTTVKQADFAAFLNGSLADAAARAGLPEDESARLVQAARAAVDAMTGWHLPPSRERLFATADQRVTTLRKEVCALAGSLRTDIETAAASEARRSHARAVLGRVKSVLTTIALTLAVATPAQIATNVSLELHETSHVVLMYLMAEQAHPHLTIAPPGPEMDGPGIRP